MTFNNRATISDVRNYYTEFVKLRHLESNFHDHHVVTSVQKVFKINNHIDMESGEVLPCCRNVKKNHPYHWEVRGYKLTDDTDDRTSQREEFCFTAPHVVIATGTFDIPNRLNIPGETLPHVYHSLHELDHNLNGNMISSSSNGNDPILVVGAGLSAADAILMALKAERQVIHVFRSGANDSSLIFKKLPAGMYPEYHQIHSLMKGTICNPLYRPYPKHRIEEIKEDMGVLLEKIDSDDITSVDISCVIILIGARPDLSFLQQDGRNLGIVSRHPIDSKHNPIDIDLYSYQSNQVPGLFALGPLIGDNFVRFGIAGTLGVTNYLLRKRRKHF